MEIFWKTISLGLIASVFVLAIGKQERDISTVLTMIVCSMVGTVLLTALQPVLQTLRQWSSEANLQFEILETLFKALGIGFVGELAGMVCKDAGNSSLGSMMQMLASATILSLTMPVLQSLLSLIQEILRSV